MESDSRCVLNVLSKSEKSMNIPISHVIARHGTSVHFNTSHESELVPLWLQSLPLQSLSSSLLSLLSAPSSASSATTAAHGLSSASSARIYDCTAARVGSSSSFGGATNPGCWAAGRSPPTGSPGGPTWCGSASPCGCGAAGRYWRTRLWVASAASSDHHPRRSRRTRPAAAARHAGSGQNAARRAAPSCLNSA